MLSIINSLVANIIAVLLCYIINIDYFTIENYIFSFIFCTFLSDMLFYKVYKSDFIKKTEPIVETKILSSKEIVALMDSSTITGHHFLGCGCIDENMYYYYLEKIEVGCKMARILATDVSIIEDDEETPRIEEQEVWKAQNYRLIKKPTIWFSFSLFFKCKKYKVGETIQDIMTKQDNRTIIYVPKNSITTDYKINLK